MPRLGKRVTVAKGIYRDSGGFEVRVMVHGVLHSERHPLDTELQTLLKARKALKAAAETEAPKPVRGTISADTPRYLKLIRHLASLKNRRAHLRHWSDLYPRTPRHLLKRHDVIEARNIWLEQRVAPKTINHRVNTLRHLYHLLDGPREPTPCDDLAPLEVPKTIIQRVSNETILAVDRNLQAHEGDPRYPLWNAKTRARFRVLTSCGKRPCEVMRAKPEDVNLDVRVWVPRDAKGGYCPGVVLNDDQLEAWKLFIEANAWGPYNTGSFADTIRAAGWPKGVRPYQARHSTWIYAAEKGVPLDDIATGAGHKDSRLTGRVYVGVINSRLHALSNALSGRFNGWPKAEIVSPVSVPSRKSKKRKPVPA